MSLLGLEKLKNPKGKGVALPGVIPVTGMREIIAARKRGFSWDQINDKLPVRYKYKSGSALSGLVVPWWRENEPATAPGPHKRSARKATKATKRKKRHFSAAGLKAIRKNVAKARAVRAAQLNGELVATAKR